MPTAQPLATLILKNDRDDSRTIANVSPVPQEENNLADWFVKLEIANTGVSKTNNGVLILRIDELGTFIRSGPILINADTKNTYYIELQLQQDIDNDGVFEEKSILLRAIIGQPQISIDETFGEILRINLTGIEYNLKEDLTSEWHLFQTPNESFQNRIDGINLPNGSLRSQGSVNNLPTSPIISIKPSGPTTIHDTLTGIIDLLSLPGVSGGSFDDFYFDIEPNGSFTNYIAITAELFGNTDSGVTIDPLSLNVFDAGEEQTVITDNIEYKNNVIMIGTSDGGSLPMERTRFASNFEHARIRDFWDVTTAYLKGDLVKFKTTTTLNPHLITYHEAQVNINAGGADPPSNLGTIWKQDFSTYAPFTTTSAAFYEAGEIITHSTGGTTYFYQCDTSDTYVITTFTAITPPAAPTGWTFIISVDDDDYEVFESYTPWTNDVDLWKETLAGRTEAQALTLLPSGVTYEGWAFDWNVTKANYNRQDFNNHFETISPKVVNSLETSQPTSTSINAYDTQRYLLGSTVTGTDWIGNENKIAELDGDGVSGAWEFSEDPVSGDVVNNLDTGTILSYNGTIWGTLWNGTSVDNTDKPSPFHIVENVGLVAGATGISGQAVEFTYNWIINSTTDTLLNQTHYNRTSRGVWISNSFPFPRIDTTNFKTGSLVGGKGGTTTPGKGTLDTNNYDTNIQGLSGWNRGISDEDYGIISALAFKMRVSMFKDSDGTVLVQGQADIPMTFWCADKFDRIWFSKFKLRRNGQWDTVRIPIGDLAPNQLYFARWDELAKLNGITITELDFTLTEKEFSGVQFDWREMKHWGVQSDEAYVESGLYINGYQRAKEYSEDVAADIGANIFWKLIGPGDPTIRNKFLPYIPVKQNYIRSVAKIAIDDLHFEKEQITTSDDSIVNSPRTAVEHLSTERDYLNLKDRATASQARKRFFPQIWHVRSTGDVRLRFGQRFTVTGSRVPEQADNEDAWVSETSYSRGDKVSLNDFVYQAISDNSASSPNSNTDIWENLNQMVVSEVKHIFDHDGYHCEIAGFRKFVVSG